jgi:hypothetical protein
MYSVLYDIALTTTKNFPRLAEYHKSYLYNIDFVGNNQS